MKLLNILKSFRDVLYIAALIAVLLLLHRSCGDRDAYAREAAAAKDLLAQHKADTVEASRQVWQYQVDTATYRYQARREAKRADSIQRITRGLSAEIRQLHALLREPTDTATRLVISERCCDSAMMLAGEYESLRAVDSLKDAAYMGQIDIATVRVDSLQDQLERSYTRFNTLDSLRRIAFKASKPRPKISAGVAGGFAPGFGWAGASLMYSGPGGVHIRVDAGPSNLGGMYYGVGVMRVISLRKKR